ncbi:Sodium/calcium exchanger protein-domain-containing protein [Lentinula lateritia]|uniref:Sodium/calcium exchanger protein-domain-containing protein n=1 Tax=Lentinula lateritia TaxID=40482 RepID=A0ABQ8VE66_9AGAR|nr:Sodium/calcium exchanger protein-domain-containing protein [Lentinula lateritia]
MILACITFTIPPTYCGLCTYQSLTLSDPEKWENVLIISRAASILLIVVYLAYLFFHLKTHGYLFENVDSFQEDDDTQNKEILILAVGALDQFGFNISLAIITALATLYVISLMEEFAEQYSIPKTFIGLILLPLVNVDGTSALRMAMRGQMETTIDICIGSSIQIIAFVIPFLVLIGWISGRQFPLLFGIFEIITIFVSVLLTSDLLKCTILAGTRDGRSNYLKGLILLSVYVVIALASYQL